MFRTLKSKMTLVCIILIAWIAGVGITSIYNISLINKGIESLMINNYKSIGTSYNMMNLLQKQNLSIKTYIYDDTEEGIVSFYKSGQEFIEAFYVEKGNITEDKELETVGKISELYEEYKKNFSVLQEKYNLSGVDVAREFYNNDIMKNYNLIIDELNTIKTINEDAMNNSRTQAVEDTTKSKYIIIIMSAIAVTSGYIITTYLINKILKPLKLLNESIVSVKEGNIGVQVPVTSKDELGDLTIEYNRMNERLHKFEKSTLGELVKEKNKSLAIVKSIKDSIIVLDKDYRIILVNQQCEDFFEIEEKVSINRYVSQVIKDENVFEAIYEITSNKDIRDKVIRIIKNDEEYYFKLAINEIIDEESKVYGYIAVLQDITNFKEVEMMKSDFLATISHEFKTSLTSIMIGTSLLESKKLGELSDKQRKILDTIKDDGERLNKLIADLITLRKMESSKELYNFGECNIDEIIRASITTVKSLAEDKDIILEYDIEKNIPTIVGDGDKLVWVVNNLISNAIKNCNKGDVIAVMGFVRASNIVVSIADTGCGMPKELTSRIFDKYVQLKNGESVPQGFGLGLSIARGIIEGHKGKIWCESEIDKGSIFTFTIPLGEE